LRTSQASHAKKAVCPVAISFVPFRGPDLTVEVRRNVLSSAVLGLPRLADAHASELLKTS